MMLRDRWKDSRRRASGPPARAPAIPATGGLVKRVTAYVPVEDWRELRVRCAAVDRSVSDVIAELVSGWLEAGRR